MPPMPVLPPGRTRADRASRGRRLRAGVTSLTALALALLASDSPPRAAAQASPERSVSLGSGAWSWFSDPRAVHHRGRHRRTYVGWIDGRGSVVVASMDLDTGARRKAILKREMQRDDHINPSLHVRADGRIMAFYGPHGGPRAKMYYRVTRRPEDITSWGPTHTMSTNSRGTHGFCYSNPLQLGGWTYVFWRGGNLQPTYSRSSDGGRTWSRAREMISAVDGRATRPYMRPYVKYATDGGKIHLAFTETNPGTLDTSIHYAAYRNNGYYRANGTLIGSASTGPLRPRAAEKLYDAKRQGGKAWIYDVAHDGHGRPVVVYAEIRSSSDHRYHYARWTGRRWLDRTLVSTSSLRDDYSPGISLDHDDPSIAYLSRKVAGKREVEIWATADGGQTWAHRPVTRSSTVDNIRPISPRRLPAGEDLEVLWMRGAYPSFTTYATTITGTRREVVAAAQEQARTKRVK